MSDKAWKAAERRVAADFGAERRGADFGDLRGGKSDLIGAEPYSVEIKSYARWGSHVVQEALEQSARASTEAELPIVVMLTKNGDRMKTGIVCIRYEDFLDWYVTPKD